MNKNELISSIANETGLTKTDAAKAVDAFVASISSALKSGDEVRLVGFGTFAVSFFKRNIYFFSFIKFYI